MEKMSKKQFKKLWRTSIKFETVYCLLCNCPITDPRDLTVEHIQPLSRGGVDNCSNWAPAHKSCNCQKGALTLAEWHQWLELERKRYGHQK